MSAQIHSSSNSHRSDIPVGEGELDDDLAKLVRRTSIVRQGFYIVVLLVALAGQVSGAVETLGIPLVAAIPALGALELGGIVVLANADVRRRLGERAVASRLLSVAIAGSAVTFNWLAHKDHLLGGFFAGMSALGYLVWLMHTENQRRDRLRIKGDLPPTTPAYELIGHWVKHPMLTTRARALAKADPRLGLYDSIATARSDVRREHRQAAIAKVLHRKIRSAVDPKTADIAIAVYDLDEIASRLSERADYDGLTALIAADLAPERLAPAGLLVTAPAEPKPELEPEPEPVPPAPTRVHVERRSSEWEPTDISYTNGTNGSGTNGSGTNGSGPISTPELVPIGGRRGAPAQASATDVPRRRRRATPSMEEIFVEPAPVPVPVPVAVADPVVTPARRAPDLTAPSSLFTSLRRDLSHLQPRPSVAVAPSADDSDEDAEVNTVVEGSLRRRVHAALDANVLPGDQRDDTELVSLVFDELGLTDLERLSAQSYVRSWMLELRSGERVRTA